jgi:hypothetical protein
MVVKMANNDVYLEQQTADCQFWKESAVEKDLILALPFLY